MAIRIKCTLEGFEKNWIDFRSDRWPFGDRRAMIAGATDIESLEIILSYVETWSIYSVDEKKITFDAEKKVDNLDTIDELLVNWIIAAWFEARSEREQLPKKV